MHRLTPLFSVTLGLLVAFDSRAADWPQFRGVNSSGRAAAGPPLPTTIGPDKNVVWKAEVPPGHSSPIVVGDHVYMTAVRDKMLLTIALDRASGKLLWEVEVPSPMPEKV